MYSVWGRRISIVDSERFCTLTFIHCRYRLFIYLTTLPYRYSALVLCCRISGSIYTTLNLFLLSYSRSRIVTALGNPFELRSPARDLPFSKKKTFACKGSSISNRPAGLLSPPLPLCLSRTAPFRKKLRVSFHAQLTLQEWGEKPTADAYADGQMSLPSA
jgi:hypothetical protein